MRVIMISFCIFIISCNNPCKGFSSDIVMASKRFTSVNCFENGDCCKKFLLSQLEKETTSPQEIETILTRLVYFPEVSKKIINILKKNHPTYYNDYKSHSMYRNIPTVYVAGFQKIEIPNTLPNFLSGFEKNILDQIFKCEMFSRQSSEFDIVLIKNSIFYIYLSDVWRRIANLDNLHYYHLINLDNVIFNKKKDRILIVTTTKKSESNYIFEKKSKYWKRIAAQMLSIK